MTKKKMEQTFKNILSEMQVLYNAKNADYGNSFSDTSREFGYVPAVARINDKLNRIKRMVKGGEMNINESMRDNLIDIAVYSVLTIMEIDRTRNKARGRDNGVAVGNH